jgi:hypothetical protein
LLASKRSDPSTDIQVICSLPLATLEPISIRNPN